MPLKIHIIAAALPPQLDGLGDYTSYLSAELTRSGVAVTVLTGAGGTPTPIPGVEIRQVFDVARPNSVRDLLPIIQADAPDWVLLQYNPFSYGRRGLNLVLPQVMRQIKRVAPDTRFALMIHESYVPVISVPFAVMTIWQRWQFRQLGHTADLMFCSIEPWTRRFSRWFPKTPIYHLPVGANITREPITREEARARLGIAAETLVLGLFGSAHMSRLLGWVREAAKTVIAAGHDVVVLYMGPDSEIVCRELGDVPTLAEGPLSGEEVSRRFAAVDIALAPFTDGISTRRGSLMAALQHGVAIVGTKGHSTDSMLVRENEKSFLLADAGSPNDFNALVLRLTEDAMLRERLGRAGQALYAKECDWDVITRRTLELMASVEKGEI